MKINIPELKNEKEIIFTIIFNVKMKSKILNNNTKKIIKLFAINKKDISDKFDHAITKLNKWEKDFKVSIKCRMIFV